MTVPGCLCRWRARIKTVTEERIVCIYCGDNPLLDSLYLVCREYCIFRGLPVRRQKNSHEVTESAGKEKIYQKI